MIKCRSRWVELCGSHGENYSTYDAPKLGRRGKNGLLNRVVADSDLAEESLLLAASLAQSPPSSLAFCSRWTTRPRTWSRGNCHEEGVRSFAQKQKPVFRGALSWLWRLECS